MISSRRLAREWALRILYQKDVGKSTLSEALASALERLRLEFVQRGSRTASGSSAEQICLDYCTRMLSDVLLNLRRPFEHAITSAVAQLLAEAPCWQEFRFEKAFKTAVPGVPLVPPRLLVSRQTFELLPAEGPDATDHLTASERLRLLAFIDGAFEELPRLLDVELRQNARQFAREIAENRPLGAAPEAVQRFLLGRREAHNELQTERWRKVGAIVQKQMGDWLRTAAFTVKLATGAEVRGAEIDSAIGDLSAGWKLERQVAVDRNILRLAGYEILFLSGVPTGVAINEAVELAKKYSTSESGRFVNGVLGALAARAGDKSSAAKGEFDADDPDDALDLPDITAIEDHETE